MYGKCAQLVKFVTQVVYKKIQLLHVYLQKVKDSTPFNRFWLTPGTNINYRLIKAVQKLYSTIKIKV